MSDKDEGNRPDKGRGSLKDDAAGSSGRSARNRSWNSVIRKATGNTSSASEESRSNLTEAVEAVAEEHARQKEVSQLAKLEPLNEFLTPREGDDEKTIADLDGNIRTVFQDRVLKRITTLTELRRSRLMEEGEEGPTVTKIGDELLILGEYIPRGKGSVLDENSVFFELDHVIRERRKSEPLEPSADDIGPVLEEEGLGTDSWDGLGRSFKAITGKKGEAPVGLGKGIDEGAGLSETRLWNTTGPEGEAAEGPEDASDTWFQNEDGVAGSVNPIPARPSMIEGVELAEIPVLDGLEIRPMGPEEIDLIAKLDECDCTDLQEMALTRRFRAEENIKGAHALNIEVDVEGIENLLAQAEALEKESDRRNPNNSEEAVSTGTVIRSKKEVGATGPVGVGVSKKEKGKGRLETVVGVRPVRPVSRPPSSRTVIKKGGEAQKTSEPVGAGVPKAEKMPMEKTVLEMHGVEGDASAKEGVSPREDSGLSQSGLFAGLDDTEMGQLANEGSRADILIDIIEGDGPKRKREVSERMDTGAMKTGENGVGNVASLEGTSIRVPQKKKPRAVESPTQRKLELANTRLSTSPPQWTETAPTKDIELLEDFSRYGDIFYAMETVFVESGTKRSSGLKEFADDLTDAIRLAEKIAASEDTVYDGDMTGVSPEMRRMQRLRAFKKEFIGTPDKGIIPRKELKQYLLWQEMQSNSHKRIAGVFDALEVSPGEYSRKGILRICAVSLENGELSKEDAEKVHALKEMLEAKKGEGEIDEFAAERIAELNYEMVVGFGTKRERELRKNQVEGVLRMEAELTELKLKISAFKQNETQMVDILANLYASVKTAGSKQEGMAKYIPEIRMALMKLEPDNRERDKYMKALFRALKGEGEIGVWLGKKAKDKLDRELRVAEMASAEQARYSRKGSGVAKGIAIATTLPFVGAAILAGGLWLGQQGITLPFGKNVVDAQKDSAAKVYVVKTDTVPSAGVVGGVDAQAEEAGPEETAETNSDLGGNGPEPDEEAEVDTEPERVKVTGGDEEVVVEEPTEAEEEPTEGETLEGFARTRIGLRLALNDWCADAKFIVVDNEMFRAAYASTEEAIIKRARDDGKEIPLPGDASWPKTLLRMKFDNSVYELAVMSDLWRLTGKSIKPEERYAAGMRLATMLGYGAGDKRSLGERIKLFNNRNKRKDKKKGTVTPEIPGLGKDSLLGATEYHKKGDGYGRYTSWQSNCLVCSLYDTVVSELTEIPEREKIMVAQEAVLDKLGKSKEINKETYHKLAGEIEEVGHYFIKKRFVERAIEIIEAVAGESAAKVIEKINKKGLYRKIADDLKRIEGLEQRDVSEIMEQIREIKKDKAAEKSSERYSTRVLEAIVEGTIDSFSTEKTTEKFAKRMKSVMNRSMKERKREFLGRVRIVLGARDDKVFKKFENAKWEANGPRRTKKLADACRVLTQGKLGRGALEQGRKVKREWDWIRLKKKRQEARRQAEVDNLTGGAFNNKKQLNAERKKGEKVKKRGKKKTRDLSEDTLPDFLNKLHEKNIKSSMEERKARRSQLFSYRGGVGRDESETIRRAKRETYLERGRVRLGVEKKSSPFKRLASKLGIGKGFGRATARA